MLLLLYIYILIIYFLCQTIIIFTLYFWYYNFIFLEFIVWKCKNNPHQFEKILQLIFEYKYGDNKNIVYLTV